MITFFGRRMGVGFVSLLLLFGITYQVVATEDLDPVASNIPMVTNNFSAKPSNYTGAFSYSYPFTLPAGRNGMQPNLALSYSSSETDNGNWAGYGWSLSLPKIERLNRFGVDTQYTEHEFSTSYSGELEDVTLVDAQHGTYGAKVDDGSFLTYVYNADETWTVTDKQGVVHTFGGVATARVQNPTNASQVKTWYLTKMEDKNRNMVVYTYTKDGEQVYPASINYTGNAATAGIYDVLFTLENRPDVTKSYASGFLVTTAKRISQVTVKANNADVRRYVLAYGSGANGVRSVLSSVTETGVSETGASLSKPATRFTYQQPDFNNYHVPVTFPVGLRGLYGGNDRGVYVFDANGDAYPDFVQSEGPYNPTTEEELRETTQKVYINNRNNTWTEQPGYIIPVMFKDTAFRDRSLGVRIADADGDGLQDIYYATGFERQLFTNNGDGTGWTLDPIKHPHVSFISSNHHHDAGVRILDSNGDGLPDELRVISFSQGDQTVLMYAHFNTGDVGGGWDRFVSDNLPDTVGYQWYSDNNGVRQIDINGDGLLDVIYAYLDEERVGRSTENYFREAVFLNDGTGGWTEDPNFSIPVPFTNQNQGDMGVRFADLNNDGLVDIIQGLQGVRYVEYWQDGVKVAGNTFTYMNKGDGTWTVDQTHRAPTYFADSYGEESAGTEIMDIDGDMDLDYFRGQFTSNDIFDSTLYSTDTKPTDILTQVVSDAGATTTVTYTSSAPTNPNLAFPLYVVSSITTNDGLAHTATTNYTYEDGFYFYRDAFHRKFAGFGKVTTIDALGYVTKEYFHQGNATDATHGESTEDESKIGRRYRQEVYDNTNHLVRTTIDTVTNFDLGHDRDFVYVSKTLELQYDADADHKDKAVEYTYNTSTGNLSELKEWGVVTGSDNGTFVDVGAVDTRRTTYTYATFQNGANSSFKTNESVFDATNVKVKETKWTYDGLVFGTVSLGNMTLQSQLMSGNVYADTRFTYDTYGMMLSLSDPSLRVTRYVWDTAHLYPATVTNPLNQSETFVYDYSSGKPTQKTDANSKVYQTVYDAFDRPVTEKQPPATGLAGVAQLETKTTYTYQDVTVPLSIQKTDWLTAAIQVESYTYLDGFGRVIQTRQEAEGGNYNVMDITYDARGDKQSSSLPYSSAGSARTPVSGTTALFETTTYDALHRPLVKTNAAGTTTYSYEDWGVTETNPNNVRKDMMSDAFGNLVSVTEYVNNVSQTTSHVWSAIGNLKKVTDALGNVRNFTYDGLGNLLTAEDLHATNDTHFGLLTYTYSRVSNRVSEASNIPTSIAYSYDSLNRLVVENALNVTGVEVTRTFDACTNGVGHLCSATMLNSAVTTYTYDNLGRVATETKRIENVNYTTTYTYDRQGNQLTVTYPDSSVATNTYATASGVLTSVTFQDQRLANRPTTTVVSNITYGPHGKATAATYGNGTSSTWTYDATKLYRLSTLSSSRGANSLQNMAYTYDNLGNILTIADTTTSYLPMNLTYTYDNLSRLTRAVSASNNNALAYTKTWTYNALGNITNSSDLGNYTYGGGALNNYANPHAVTSVNNKTYTYSRTGNVLTDGTWTNTWDYKNRLLTSRNAANVTVTYKYDANGVRTFQDGAGPAIIYPNDLYTVDGTSYKRHVMAGSLGSVMTSTWNGAVSTSVYHLKDHLGGTHLETDTAGLVVEYILYTPFGVTLLDQKTGSYANNLKYTGKEKDVDTGWYYYGARYYNPSVGQFLSEDPVFLEVGQTQDGLSVMLVPQAINSYSYSLNNPIVKRDPDGRCVEDLCIGEAIFGLTAIVAMYGPQINSFLQFSASPLGQASIDSAITDTQTLANSDASYFDKGVATVGLGMSMVPPAKAELSAGLQVAKSDAAKGIYRPLSNYIGEVSAASYAQLKNIIGSASETIGEGFQWHHIVEQNSQNIAKFGQEMIQNTKNIMALPQSLHIGKESVSALYSRMSETGTSLRKEISSFNFQDQFSKGVNAVKDVISNLNQ